MHNDDSRIGDYLEPGYDPQPVFLEDDIYSQLLDAVVITCVDLVIMSEGKVLLGKRAWHPQADWWLVGGRMRPGEELTTTAGRNARRELGIGLEAARFEYLTGFSAAWQIRRHAPAEHGTHTYSVVMLVRLSAEEAETIRLNEEYTNQQWLTPEAILANQTFHPALHQCMRAFKQLPART
jgi:ADP-ribose pyrophosphatase YjhB (NUDIX family)